MLSFYILLKLVIFNSYVFSILCTMWYLFDSFLFILQILSLYVLHKLFSTSNHFKKIFCLGYFLIIKSFLIFYYQSEVYASFLLINELVVALFFFLLLIFSGFNGSSEEPKINNNLFIFIIALFSFSLFIQTPMAYYLESKEVWDWYDYYILLIFPTHNDLIAPFIFYYYSRPDVLLMVSFLLLILSIVYIYFFFKILGNKANSFFKQNNNIQDHNMRKPSINSFKTTFNDL